MKKLLSLALVLTFINISATAQTFNYNGINYNITNDTNFKVEVGDNVSYTGVANIPNTVIYNSQSYEVTNIGSGAFYYCTQLTSVTIPNSVTSIGSAAFYCCAALTFVTIPNSITSIGNRTFDSCTMLTSVTIPNSVTSIGNSTFEDCYSLSSVTIPNSVTTIGNYAFSSSHLLSVTIPNSVTMIGIGTFQNCTSLTSATIPNSVITIGNGAFQNCLSLTSLTIPNSVINIGSYVFSRCLGLTSVTIGNSVTNIGNGAFYNCSGLTTVNCYIQNPLSIDSTVFQGVNQATCALNVNDSAAVLAYEATPVWTNFNPINGVLASDSFVKNSFSMYPNPSNGVLNISLQNNLQLEKVTFYNQLGQVVKTATTHIICISELAKGNYFVEVVTNETKAIKTIVIQ